jgi:hypothetical protein
VPILAGTDAHGKGGPAPVDHGSSIHDEMAWLVETGLVETGLVETGLVETGLVETGLVETGLVETGLVETGLSETEVLVAATPWRRGTSA